MQFINLVTPREAKEILVQSGAMLVDIREPFEIKLMAIKGLNILYIPLGDLPINIDLLREYSTIVLICRTDKRSSLAAQTLVSQFRDKSIFVVKGGIIQWWIDYPMEITESKSASDWYAI